MLECLIDLFFIKLYETVYTVLYFMHPIKRDLVSLLIHWSRIDYVISLALPNFPNPKEPWLVICSTVMYHKEPIKCLLGQQENVAKLFFQHRLTSYMCNMPTSLHALHKTSAYKEWIYLIL